MSVACVLINSIEATSVCGIMSLQTVAAAAYLVIALNRKKKRRKPRWWRRQLYVGGQEAQNDSLNKLIADDQALFRNFTRMSQEDFEYLLEKISPIIRKSDTNFREAIPTRIRLLVTLRYLATGDSYASLMYLFRISVPSISRIIPEVCKALIDVLHDFVRIPDTEDGWKKIARDFEVLWNYPHCIGACDGKHIVLQNPKNSGSLFYNYKGTFSVVLMAVTDADYNFIYANIGCQGRISDGGVFRETIFYKKLANNNLALPAPESLPGSNRLSPYVILTDDAFPLQEHILKPFSGYHDKGSCERVYNYRHSRARRVVENSFGLLASVFRVFRKPLMVHVDNAEIITTTCIYLHNFLRRSKTSRPL
ncbi:unnamed protein product [Acanthoscelides obtectus]|uniref:DDE Tnp4 domain-containing protein n=1 Tax=Acanthoscelides obtectus TaxID=200917 RepID=A0A9P0LF51_ACAOB|nr:unnamed protein product [Acanthoscelides obtectus]CAK1631352.1 Protein ANTAGONIST OF LIKE HETEROCHROMATIN PROTEIN 1 [Acanthoscelides obtectus]